MVHNFDVVIIGSGMGSLTSACLLAQAGAKVAILEQNYLPGGCTSSYWRKGFIFESGATTLVGLDEHMPLRYLLDTIGISIPTRKLEIPMQVKLSSGQIITRHRLLEDWIAEAESVFGAKGQREFWELCYKVSQFVWKTSLKQKNFPIGKLSDLSDALRGLSFEQLKMAPYSLISTEAILKKFDLHMNNDFVDFVNEQLLITAQNHIKEVNFLFGATALCYTNYDNHYIDGGLINLVNPLISYIQKMEGQLFLRTGVNKVLKNTHHYSVITRDDVFNAPYVLSGIPVNNILQIYPSAASKWSGNLLKSKDLNSAFQMGIAFKSNKRFDVIHHQIHLKQALPGVGSESLFISLSHPDDKQRSDEPGFMVASVSTHVADPEKNWVDKDVAEQAVISVLEDNGFLDREEIVYYHSSSPKSWEKWTGRAFGFVGGYPQFMNIKPWQMNEARIDGKGLYLCGDTAYPGQGIPGTCLSGIIAFEKMKADGLFKHLKFVREHTKVNEIEQLNL
jgi:phytoene dehydrogenase-like protein